MTFLRSCSDAVVPQISSLTQFFDDFEAGLSWFSPHFAAFCGLRLLDVESQRSVDFMGALDGQQLLVVEGSGMPGSPGVLLPGHQAPEACSIRLSRCGHTHDVECSPLKEQQQQNITSSNSSNSSNSSSRSSSSNNSNTNGGPSRW